MTPAATYNRRLEWLKRTPGVTDSFGERGFSFPSQGFLWAGVEEVSAVAVEKLGRDREQRLATVRIRNYPAVTAPDRLVDSTQGVTWKVTATRRGVNELVCECETNP